MKITATVAAMLAACGAAIWWREILAYWPWVLVFVGGAEIGAHCIDHPRPPLLRAAAALQWMSAALRAFAKAQRIAFELARYDFPGILRSFRAADMESLRQGTTGAADRPHFFGGAR